MSFIIIDVLGFILILSIIITGDTVIAYRRYKRIKRETVNLGKLSKLQQIDRRILFTVFPPIEAVISKSRKSKKLK